MTEAISNAFKPNLDPWIIQFSSSMISMMESRIKVLDEAIAKAVDSIPRLKEYVNRLLTIKGVGLGSAQAITAEIADVSRFESSGSLVRYAGINPTVMQSGSMRRYGPLEKGGPPHLRRAPYHAFADPSNTTTAITSSYSSSIISSQTSSPIATSSTTSFVMTTTTTSNSIVTSTTQTSTGPTSPPSIWDFITSSSGLAILAVITILLAVVFWLRPRGS